MNVAGREQILARVQARACIVTMPRKDVDSRIRSISCPRAGLRRTCNRACARSTLNSRTTDQRAGQRQCGDEVDCFIFHVVPARNSGRELRTRDSALSWPKLLLDAYVTLRSGNSTGERDEVESFNQQ